jgi:hypothetical protein
MTPQPLTDSPLNTDGAITELIHCVHGKQLREALPEVLEEMTTAENSAAQDIVDEMNEEVS